MSPQHPILKHLFLFIIVNKVEIKLTLLGFFFYSGITNTLTIKQSTVSGIIFLLIMFKSWKEFWNRLKEGGIKSG
jgi:hypothetical protein